MITKFISEKKFAVAHNDLDVFILCELENQEISTGQPYLEIFDTLEEAKAKFGDKIETEEIIEEEVL